MKLSQLFIDQQKAILLEEKTKIEEQIKVLKKYPDYGGVSDDKVQELTDYESNLAVEDQLELLLGKINLALTAIDKGEYGQCSQCQQAIENGRLKIMPYADLCVTCQNDVQKKR